MIKMNFNTALLHKGAERDKATGATLPPIYQVSAFEHESAEQLEKVFDNRAAGFAYTRIANPTVNAFERRIAAIENAVAAVACSSGMAAVTMSLLNILKAGDEIIAGAGLFGGTLDLFGDMKAYGISTRFVNHVTAENIEPLINEKTRVIYAELIGNPALDVVDIKSVSELAHRHGIPLIIDSTTATPYLIKPLDFGADIVIHSSSKYINGGGNSISGVIVDGGKFNWDFSKYDGLSEYKKFGKLAYTAKLRGGIWRNVGACLAPMNAFMNIVGLETMGLRMERCCENAKRLAEFLEKEDKVQVNYPALKSSPYYRLCQSQFAGKGGGIVTIRAGSRESAFKLINSLKYASVATNIGDVRTLVIHAASTIYIHSDERCKANAGVFDDTVRISVGIEDIDDLIGDFKQATEKI